MLPVTMHFPKCARSTGRPSPGRPHRPTDINMQDGPGAGERLALKDHLQEEAIFQSSPSRMFCPRVTH